MGACGAAGTLSCKDGSEVDSCEAGSATGDDSDCDGVDDDCDGGADEHYVPSATACGLGVCAASGALTCAFGAEVDSCEEGASSDEVCDGLDNDCDGAVDQGATCAPGEACDSVADTDLCLDEVVLAGGSCGGGATLALPMEEGGGTQTGDVSGEANDAVLFNPLWVAGKHGAAAVEFDEAPDTWLAAPLPSGTATSFTFATWVRHQSAAGRTLASRAGTPESQGLTIENDGHVALLGGVYDLGYDLPPDDSWHHLVVTWDGGQLRGYLDGAPSGSAAVSGAMTWQEGIAVGGLATCAEGCMDPAEELQGAFDDLMWFDMPMAADAIAGLMAGVPAIVANEELCDGLDNDCDGVVDDGACEACVATGDDDNCDGVDNDCDGQVDEGWVAATTSCGVGACGRTGKLTCAAGSVIDTCAAGAKTGDDTDCDGVDDDCDGQVDEAYLTSTTSCGTGACAATGTLSCVGGTEVDTCKAGGATGDDTDCDGVDDDCDGAADEHYVITATTCGKGACARSGQLTCQAGDQVDTCEVGDATGDDTECDDVDDDCDGLVDEHYAVTSTSCGQGACASTGTKTCESGSVVDSCEQSLPTGDDTDCDGVDDDCDGAADEHYVTTATGCGVGACAATGTLTCQSGAVVDSCKAGAKTGDDADCDGVDDDCDGQADEGYLTTATSCGIGACGATGTLSCKSGAEVDSCAAGAKTGDDTDCDGVDDDCDGQADEGYVTTATSCGVGACAASGTLTCQSGSEVDSCKAGAKTGDDTDCDGVDDDCDGQADEGYVTSSTSCGVGVCASSGTLSCKSGAEVDSCTVGAKTGDDTDCDGVDDDCDGQADEGYVVTSTSCGVGACGSTGKLECTSGSEVDSCSAGAKTGDDTDCDGVDDDCDGQADEHYATGATSCGVGACASTGTLTCKSGAEVDSCTVGAKTGDDTDCDGVDDDCDGQVDESYVATSTSCGVGACGSTGKLECTSGSEVDSCSAGAKTGPDTDCDGVDDDCDGQADEHYVTSATACGVGACAASGTLSCKAGSVVDSCKAGAKTGDDTDCDGVDDDCDGQADEGYVTSATSCGVGACGASGTLSCQGGATVDSCKVGAKTGNDTDCDGVDDDCDGQVDEGYVVTSTSCGVGACAASGKLECKSGSVVNSCKAGPKTGADTDCDGIDDDCDGQADEHFATSVTSCGVGACGSTGLKSCKSGSVVDSCKAGAKTGNDTDCDGVDDDCDGSTDEGYATSVTSCGIGACAASGVSSCKSGSVVDSCSPGAKTGSDADCDGVDDDCDGSTDESYVVTATFCGVGACGSSGKLECKSGSPVNSCAAGPKTGNDSDCDGVDDDCDGQADEHYPSSVTSCGIGACSAKGVSSCQSGSVVDSCSPGSVTGNDTDCDGVDDDCDGSTDEGYGVSSIACGAGACSAVGTHSCVSGKPTDSCVPKSPTGNDSDCDGVDDDCDGATDELAGSKATSCGQGVCATTGTESCVNGAYTDSCSPKAPTGDDNNCDGLDDDCDGETDEGCSGAGGLEYKISGGDYHTCAVGSNDTAYCWGRNNYKQVGPNGGNKVNKTPVPVMSNVAQVGVGAYHSCALTKAGEIYCWGYGGYGALGYGGSSSQSAPVKAGSLSDYVQLSAGYLHTCALRKNGEVWCWGDGYYGQVGNGSTATAYVPKKVTTLTDAVQVEAGDIHNCAVTKAGDVWCWGNNNSKQLGNDGYWIQSKPAKVAGLTGVLEVGGGVDHTCALKSDGKVACFGRNQYYQFGQSAGSPTATPVGVNGVQNGTRLAVGGYHSCVRTSANQMVCWGLGQKGQMGAGGYGYYNSATNVGNFPNVEFMGLGYEHTCAINFSGEVACWGEGAYYRLGYGGKVTQPLPAKVTGVP